MGEAARRKEESAVAALTNGEAGINHTYNGTDEEVFDDDIMLSLVLPSKKTKIFSTCVSFRVPKTCMCTKILKKLQISLCL